MSMDNLKLKIRSKAADLGVQLTHDQTKAITERFFELIVEEVQEDGRLIVRGFGTFSAVHKQARLARNPATGQEVKVAAKTVLKLKSKLDFMSMRTRAGSFGSPPVVVSGYT